MRCTEFCWALLALVLVSPCRSTAADASDCNLPNCTFAAWKPSIPDYVVGAVAVAGLALLANLFGAVRSIARRRRQQNATISRLQVGQVDESVSTWMQEKTGRPSVATRKKLVGNR